MAQENSGSRVEPTADGSVITIEIEGCGSMTATRKLLNRISVYMSHARDNLNREACYELAKDAEEIRMTIYNGLDESGYFDYLRSF